MTHVLLTGMSAAGKSTIIHELSNLGHLAVDLDCPEYSQWVDVTPDALEYGSTPVPGKDWVWNEQAVWALLRKNQNKVLYVSGCAANMRGFLPSFQHIILLSAPSEVLIARLEARTVGYGITEEERLRVLDLKERVEPFLRRIATLEIDTTMPLEQTVAHILTVASVGHDDA
jgi:shikimate kinase